MILEILFTTTTGLFSRLIRKVTKEPVSHCAIRVNEFVIHSTFLTGVTVVPFSVFSKNNEIRYRHKLNAFSYIKLRRMLYKYYGRYYDYGAFLYIGLRYLFPKFTKKHNLWQCTGMFLCTEFVTNVIWRKEDSMLTPYKLYQKLLNL